MTGRETPAPSRTEGTASSRAGQTRAGRTVGILIERALIFEGLLLLFLSEKHRIIGDGMPRYVSLRLLFERGELSEMAYSMIGPLLASPLYWLDRVVGPPLWWSSRYNFFVLLIGLGLLYRLLRPRMEPGTLRKLILLLVAASMFGRHQMDFYGEVFTAMVAGVGLVSLATGVSVWAGLALIVAVANVPATLGGLILASVGATFFHRRWRLLGLPLGAAALIMAESWLRRGHPLASGYEGNAGFETALPYSGLPGFSYPLFFGVLSILFSFGKGLMFFAPGLFLPVRTRISRLDPVVWRTWILWLLFLAGMVLVYAKWWSWYGGWYWGPRFFLFASLPACLALAVMLADRPQAIGSGLLTLTVLVLSVLVGVTGVVFEQAGLQVCAQDSYALEALCWYVPELSALFNPFVATKPLLFEDWLFLFFGAITLVWLGAPVVRHLSRQSVALLRATHERLAGEMRF